MTLPIPAAEPPANEPAAEAPAPPPETPSPAPAPEAPTQDAAAPAPAEQPAPAPSQLPPAMTPPPAAVPTQYAPPMPTGPIPVQSVPTGPMLVPPPPLPRKPSKAGTVVLVIALVVVALVAGAFAYVYTQASGESDARAAEIEELTAAQDELEAENGELVNDLAGLQLTADDFEACQTAFDAYNSFEFEGEIDPNAENFEDLFTDEYIEYQNQAAELYQDVIVKCSP